MFLLVLFSLQCAAFWLARYECSHTPYIANLIKQSTLPFNLLGSDPLGFAKAAGEVMALALIKDFFLPPTLWLPFSLTAFPGEDIAIAVFMLIASAMKVGIFIYCLVFTLKRIAAGYKGWSALNLLAMALILSLTASMVVTGTARSFYLRSLEMPLLYLSFLFCLASQMKPLCERKWRYVFLFLGVVALGNSALLLLRYYPYMTDPATRTAEVALKDYRRATLYSPFTYETQRAEVNEAYGECGLPPVAAARHLVLDSFTYPVLLQSYQPFELLYFMDGLKGEHLGKDAFFARLREYQSDGVIAQCSQLPESYLPAFSRHGSYCCMKPAILPKD